jgi:hypothetical protein
MFDEVHVRPLDLDMLSDKQSMVGARGDQQ